MAPHLLDSPHFFTKENVSGTRNKCKLKTINFSHVEALAILGWKSYTL